MQGNMPMNTEEKKLDTEEKETAAPVVSMDALTSDDVFPDAQPHAIQATQEKMAQEKAEQEKQAQENVTYNKDGSVRKKRGRKPNAEKKFINPRDKKAAETASDILKADSTQAAQIISGMLEQMQVTLISDEFEYNQMEKDLNILAWKDTLDYYGGLQVSPPMSLVISHMGIILSRAQQPKTQTKFGLIKAWFANKIAQRKKKKENKNALSDSGQNNERENDLRKEESKKS